MNPDFNRGHESNIWHKSTGTISESQSENFDFHDYFKSLLINKPAPPVNAQKTHFRYWRNWMRGVRSDWKCFQPGRAHPGTRLRQHLVLTGSLRAETAPLGFGGSRSCHGNTESYFFFSICVDEKKERAWIVTISLLFNLHTRTNVHSGKNGLRFKLILGF